MQGRHFEMTMARAYVYNKVRSLLAVFVAFEVLNREDKKRGRREGKISVQVPYFIMHTAFVLKELAIEDTAQYKDMMRMSHSVFQRMLSYIEQDITL